MRSFFEFVRKVCKDRRGNALVIAGLSLPLIVGAAGLGTDTIQWVVWKRELQRAADSAAFAGVYAKVQNNGNKTAAQAVSDDLDKNNHAKVALLSGYPQLAYPTSSGWTDAVQVTLAVSQPLGFSGLFLSAPPTVTAIGTAAVVSDGNYCLVALKPTGTGITIQGSTDVNMGCGAITNSSDPNNTVVVNGNAHNFVATPVAAVGGITTTINGSPDVRSFQLPMADPFVNVSTSVPAGMSCTNYNHASKTAANGNKNPGCYNQFNPGNGTTTLNPGTYYLNNTSLNLNGQTKIVGNGVTIILTGNNPGTVRNNGNSALAITAPTSGPYANIALIGTTSGDNKINGTNSTAIDGAIYFPNGHMEFTGNTGQSFQCAMLVSYTVKFSGNSTIQNNTSGCNANMTVSGRRVRLVA